MVISFMVTSLVSSLVLVISLFAISLFIHPSFVVRFLICSSFVASFVPFFGGLMTAGAVVLAFFASCLSVCR